MAQTTSRTLALLTLLQTHRQWSGPELARRLEVTQRTLRRDIERLRELGYRVEATRGTAGGYRLEAGSQLPPLLLTDEEAVTMAIGLRLAASQGLVDGEHTTLSALAKFEQVLPPALRRRIAALTSHLETGLSRTVEVSPDLLGQLALACRDRERIRFRYVAADGVESDRVVEPHSLVAAERNWFLVAWDRERAAWRTFRVDRMSRLFGTRLHFPARALPAAAAAEFVAVAVRSTWVRVEAAVVMRLPIAEMRARFGPWAAGATPVGDDATRWPLRGVSHEELLGALAWIPEGIDYELEASPEFVRFVAEAGERMARAGGRPTAR
jgi:predicted DNA-binding transcriptional regulator YafY